MAETVVQSILNKNRKDKFLLILNLPNILKEKNKTNPGSRESEFLNLDSIQFSVFGTVVPSVAVPDVDVPAFTQVPKFTSGVRPAWDPITVNFTIDNQYNNYWVLWYWLDLINNSTEGAYNAKNLVNPDRLHNKWASYQTDLTVYGLDEYNNKKIQFDYLFAQITALGDISYNYRDPDQLESSFTFSFGQLRSKLI
jgi:hypothetical protein